MVSAAEDRTGSARRLRWCLKACHCALHRAVQPVAPEPQQQVPHSFYCRVCHGAAGMPALLKWLWDLYISSAQPQPPRKQWDQVETRAISVVGGICVVAFRLVPHPCANQYWYLCTGNGEKEKETDPPCSIARTGPRRTLLILAVIVIIGICTERF